MITLNKWKTDCLERFRQRYKLKITCEWRIISLIICNRAWYDAHRALGKYFNLSREDRLKSSDLLDAEEGLADIIIGCIGLLDHLGVKDVEDLIKKRLGK